MSAGIAYIKYLNTIFGFLQKINFKFYLTDELKNIIKKEDEINWSQKDLIINYRYTGEHRNKDYKKLKEILTTAFLTYTLNKSKYYLKINPFPTVATLDTYEKINKKEIDI